MDTDQKNLINDSILNSQFSSESRVAFLRFPRLRIKH
jgi:hypothetical protein